MIADKHFTGVGSSASTGIRLLTSYHLKETSGTNPAVVNLRDGGSGGAIVIPIRLAANEYADMEFHSPLLSSNGWYFELVAGAVTGAFSGSSVS